MLGTGQCPGGMAVPGPAPQDGSSGAGTELLPLPCSTERAEPRALPGSRPLLQLEASKLFMLGTG